MKLSRRIKSRVSSWRMPYTVTMRDFIPAGVRFEVTNSVERHRVEEHGGETDYLKEMLATLESDDVLYDVGVCVGLVALHAAHICEVVGFEPDPSFQARFRRNLSLNPNLSVPIYEVAIGDVNAQVSLYTDGASGNSPSLRHQRGESAEIAVGVRTLDSLIFEDGLPVPSAVKFDIEGAELLALRGAQELLKSKQRPRLLFLEVHHTFLPAFGGTSEDVMTLVEGAGYRPTFSIDRADQSLLILEAG